VVVDSSRSIVDNEVVLILLEENRYPHHYFFSFFPGYDIKSFNEDGEEIFIEVKSTVSKGKDYFEISYNEVLAAELLEGSYFIYQVTSALANQKKSAIVRNPMKYVEQKKILLELRIYKMFI